MNQWVYWGYLQGRGWFQSNCSSDRPAFTPQSHNPEALYLTFRQLHQRVSSTRSECFNLGDIAIHWTRLLKSKRQVWFTTRFDFHSGEIYSKNHKNDGLSYTLFKIQIRPQILQPTYLWNRGALFLVPCCCNLSKLYPESPVSRIYDQSFYLWLSLFKVLIGLDGLLFI